MHFYNPNNPYPSCREAEATLYSFPEPSLYKTDERDCVTCHEIEDITDITDMDMDASPASSEMEVASDSDNDSDESDDGGDIPFHTPHNYITPQQLQKQKQKQDRKRNMSIPTNLSSNSIPGPTTSSANSHTPRVIKPRGFFRREALSAPVMRLREKWKENVGVMAETALWSGHGDQFGYGFGGRFGFGDVIQTGIGFGIGSVGAGEGRGPGARRFYRGGRGEIGLGHGLSDWVPY
ncbi:uncharacterized protein ACHE_20189S [Aspergillus chevalieri]|uniref:Uncharacterized protein n=1 Tax=Aspergillus chevalieri TaxID=182096 RepID=A0A7R7VHD0_ASPCH|nr:uncharacterized protein ACHE_20189S [Aspergillus chevalieri]BCR84731.1 hypothetical protein ACHE_20189S [Aspergillus chevalieri]